MASPVDEGLRAVEPQGSSFLRIVLALLVGEHVCAPPDGSTQWATTSEDTASALAPSTAYVCPECGQRLTRIGT